MIHRRKFRVVPLLLLILSACVSQTGPAADQLSIAPDPSSSATAAIDADEERRVPALSSAGGDTIALEDDQWQGGYRDAGDSVYAGRSAVWLYGTATQYSTMRATFEVIGEAFGAAHLRIEGLDDQDAIKTPIQILINDVEIFNGENPLPDDDRSLDGGAWDVSVWSFDAALLRAGQNSVEIRNLAPGALDQPPFVVLDYAEIAYESE